MVCLGLEPLESTELWLHLHFKLDLVVVDFKRKRELKRTFDQFKCPLICSSCSQSTLLFWISDRISVLHRFTYLHVYNNMNKAFKSSDYSEEACRNSSRRSRSNEGETISAKLGDCHSGEWEGLPRSSQTRYEHDGIESPFQTTPRWDLQFANLFLDLTLEQVGHLYLGNAEGYAHTKILANV